MIIDLHSHFPLHIAAGESRMRSPAVTTRRRSPGDRVRALVLRGASVIGNTRGRRGGPAVTVDSVTASNVRVILSPLYCPFDEMDLSVHYGSPPRSHYFSDLLRQMDRVERRVRESADVILLAKRLADVDAALESGRVAVVHAVEGGFHLGGTPQEVAANVAELGRRRVAYVTLAHLFWRSVATNVPALPFLTDWLYGKIFPQPSVGLTDLGRAAVSAMVEQSILVDVTHMSVRAFSETMALLDRLDPELDVPVIASHAACRVGRLRYGYNLTDAQIRAIARRRGIIGLIASAHFTTRSRRPAASRTFAILRRHIDQIHRVTGSHEFTAIGSDQDGFIKPALPGLATPRGYDTIEAELRDRYGFEDAERICCANARRVLRYWG